MASKNEYTRKSEDNAVIGELVNERFSLVEFLSEDSKIYEVMKTAYEMAVLDKDGPTVRFLIEMFYGKAKQSTDITSKGDKITRAIIEIVEPDDDKDKGD
jgi:hypothetical protein